MTNPPLTPPPLPSWQIRRPEVIRLLSDPGNRVSVIEAGSGFGKTAIVAEWIDASRPNRRVVHVALGSSASTRQGFWSLVLLTAHAQGVTDTIAPRSPDWQDAYRALNGDVPLTLILDDASPSIAAGVDEDLRSLLHLMPSLQIIATSRGPGLLAALDPDDRLAAVTIDSDHLRFGLGEIAEAAHVLGVTLAPQDSEILASDTDGWPLAVGTILGARSQPGASSRPNISVENRVTTHFDSRVSAGNRHAAQMIGAIGECDRETARAIGISDDAWTAAGDDLQRAGLAWTSADQTVHTAPVVQRALRKHLASTNAEVFRSVNRSLSRHLMAMNEPSRAFVAALEARDWDYAEALLRSNYHRIISATSRPEPVMAQRGYSARRHPFLVLFAGIEFYARGKHIAAARNFASALAICEAQRFTDRGRPSVERVWTQGLLAIGLRLAGLYQFVPRALDRFLDLLSHADDPDGELAAIETLINTQGATTFLYLGNAPAARTLLAGDPPIDADEQAQSYALQWLAVRSLAEVSDGEFSSAAATVDRIWAAAQTADLVRNYAAVPAHTAAAVLALQQHDLQRAEYELELTSDHWATMEHWPLVLHARVMLEWKRDGARRALNLLETSILEKKLRAAISPHLAATLTALRIDLLVADLRHSDAAPLVERERGSRFGVVGNSVIRHQLISGSANDALIAARRLMNSDRLRRAEQIDTFLLAASAALRVNDPRLADEFFAIALRRSDESGQTEPFAMMIREHFERLADPTHPVYSTVMDQPAYFAMTEVPVSLTRREAIVLTHLASEKTLPEIATQLSVSVNTVRNQAVSVYRKLGVARREDAVAAARESRLL